MAGRKILSILFFVFANSLLYSQRCATIAPGYEFEEWIKKNINTFSSKGMMQQFTIPVIIHVIHDGEIEGTGSNISDLQITSQIQVLDEDYNAENLDISNVPAEWKDRIANCNINFELAAADPSGNLLTEPGIDRINRNSRGFNSPPYDRTYFDASIKPATIWDYNKYLNIWVSVFSGGILGYATFPPSTQLPGLVSPYGNSETDGVVIDHRAFGTVGTLFTSYNLGRTATHEIGHWLGLRHIWGDEAGCAEDDYVSDTPMQKAENTGCPIHPEVSNRCNAFDPGSMFMDYMDYTDDACMYMFTNGQKARMHAALTTSPQRISVANSYIFPDDIMTIKPNPSTSPLSLYINSNVEEDAVFYVYDVLGNIVNIQHEPKVSKQVVALSLLGMPSGVYFIHMIKGEEQATRKAVLVNP